MYCGARQMLGTRASRMVVVSGGPSWANEVPVPIRPAAPADESVARKRRRLCDDCITVSYPSKSREIRLFGSSLHEAVGATGPTLLRNNDSTSRRGRTLLRCGI